MAETMITLPDEVLEHFADLASRRGRGEQVADLVAGAVLEAVVPLEVPVDLDRTVLAAARALLAGDLKATAALTRDVDHRAALGVALAVVNSLGVDRYGGDAGSWDAELGRALRPDAPGD